MAEPGPSRSEFDSSDQVRPVSGPELFLTVFVTGAAVMTIEIVGTRIIGPVFGVGLFVWSALLAVTLAALASGYYAGGVLADRGLTPTSLGSVTNAAGLLLALTSLVERAVLSVAEGLGPRVGPLFGAALLFAPALLALGITGPIAVRLRTKSLSQAGRGLGSVYAVSTAGSLAGTLVVGFVAIPAFDANSILTCAAGVLVLIGAGAFALRKRPLALGLLIGPVLISGPIDRPFSPGFKLLDKSQSLLGRVEVIDDQNRGVRFLRSDHSILGATYLRDGSPGFGFVQVLKAIRFCRPAAKRLLNIGLGSGAVPSALGRLGIQVDVVEIDPAIVRFAEKYFDFSATGRVYTEDARAFLRRTQSTYDLVIHDTFTGGATPEHLLSLEVLQRVRAMLRPGGVLALNFVGYYQGRSAEASFAVARTLRAVFRHVDAYRDSAPDPAEPVGNILFFASDDPIEFIIPPDTRFANATEEQIQRSFTGWKVMVHVPSGPLVTDAQNPLGRLQLPIAEQHFTAMNELLPLEVWLD
jgi:SAM-dependent methyltransferase